MAVIPAPTSTSNGTSSATGAGGTAMLRLVITGSVDDGKSTLIGRLLYDSKQILSDQLEALQRASERRNGDGALDLSLLTDGLRAEREQGITIDVAYRYFQTVRRKFIIADTPGHERYTRNMVTGTSTADLAVILIDARNGVLEQTRRHAFIASLLGIRHLVVCVNKMDLVEYRQAPFDHIEKDFREFCARLEITDVTFIPISAAHGENVVERSHCMPWYEGPSLLYHLEHVHIASDRNLIDCRFPVQWVIRPGADSGHPDYRGYAGQVASGIFRPGDAVVVLPSGEETRIASIDTLAGPLTEAFAPMSVTLRLEDDLDISRGNMICRPHNRPTMNRHVEAIVCWMDEQPLTAGARYTLKHTTRSMRAVVDDVRYRIDVNTLHRDENGAGTGAQRDRPDQHSHEPAGDVRRVPPEPKHGELHPHRRGHQRNGRGRNHHRATCRGGRRLRAGRGDMASQQADTTGTMGLVGTAWCDCVADWPAGLR